MPTILEQEPQIFLNAARKLNASRKHFEECFNLAAAKDKAKPEDLTQVLEKAFPEVSDEKYSDEMLSKAISTINSHGKLFAKLDIVEEYINFRNTLERFRRRLSLIKLNTECEQDKCEEQYKAEIKWFSSMGIEEDLELIKKTIKDFPFLSEETLRLSDIAEQDIIKRSKSSFQLTGYSHPFDEYPAPLVPIGYHQDELVAVYLDPSNPSDTFLVLDQDHPYIQFDEQLKQNLDEFNYLQDKLFAYSEDQVVLYSLDKEKEFYRDVLKDDSLSQDNPFLRYSLAKITDDIEVIEAELIRCINYMSTESSGMIQDWYKAEKDKISYLWQQNNIDFPSEESLKSLALDSIRAKSF